MFDQLNNDLNYDGALETVQGMLNHKNSQTTERYLRLGLDTARRDEVIMGLEMFGDDSKVTDMGRYRADAAQTGM